MNLGVETLHCNVSTKVLGVTESWDDFAQFGTNSQWFQLPLHPTFMQRQVLKSRKIIFIPQYGSVKEIYLLRQARGAGDAGEAGGRKKLI